MSPDRSPAADDPDEQVTADLSSTDSSLLVRVKAHDLAAWHELVRLYGPLVYEWCRRKGLQDADAADVGQEVFRAVAGGIERFRRDRPGDIFRGWLWGITRNKLRDHWRRKSTKADAEGGTEARRRLEQLSDPLPSDDAEPTTPNDIQELLERALSLVENDFEPKTWRAFWGVSIDGRIPADVAGELGMTVGSVYVAKSRVLSRLRAELSDLDDLVE